MTATYITLAETTQTWISVSSEQAIELSNNQDVVVLENGTLQQWVEWQQKLQFAILGYGGMKLGAIGRSARYINTSPKYARVIQGKLKDMGIKSKQQKSTNGLNIWVNLEPPFLSSVMQ